MFLTLVRKEFLSHLISFRFTITVVLCLLLMMISAYTLREKYERQLSEYSAAVVTHRKNLEETPNIQNLMLEGYTLDKRPSPLSVLASGLEGIGKTTQASVREEPSLNNSEASQEPLSGLFGTLDYVFITRIVLSLLALVFTYDTIAGEREHGTLKLMLSNPVPRDVVIMGKIVGSYLSLTLPFLVATFMALMVFVLSPQIQLDAQMWGRIGVLVLVSLLYIWVFTAVGLFISSCTQRSATALLSLLLIWVVSVLAVPKASNLIAGQLHRVPPIQEVEGQKVAAEQQISREANEKTLRLSELGERLYQEIAREWSAVGKNPERHPKEFHAVLMSRIMAEMTDIQKEAFDKINMERDRIQVNYERALNRQLALAMNMSRISPASSYTFAMTSLANTGITRQQSFLRDAKQYRREFSRYLNTKLSEGEGLGFNPYDPEDQVDLSALPQFSPKGPSMDASLSEVWVDILLLCVMGIGFFMAAYVSFLRYDVR